MSRSHYTPTYQSWQAMRQRCNNPNHAHFSNYGGRGIRACARWGSFEAFLKDMGERPAGSSLDRIDNGRGYDRANCRWSSRTTQNRNNSQNRLVEFAGVKRCLSEWCELLNLNYARVYARLYRLNWDVSNAFFK